MITRQTGTGYDAVDMRMVIQVLTPGVQDHDDAGLSTEIAAIVRKCEQRLRSRPEEKVVEELPIGKEQRIQTVGHSEYDMEVPCGKDLTAPLVYPYFLEDRLTVWTITVATGTRMCFSMPAFTTDADVVTKITGLAVRDRVSSSELLTGQDVILHIASKTIREESPNRIATIHDAP